LTDARVITHLLAKAEERDALFVVMAWCRAA
jgi:hypothetical protein